MYNKVYYESCDALFGISKQTVNINKLVLGDKAKNKVIEYVPHGLNDKMMFPIDESYINYQEFLEFKNALYGGDKFDFVALYNSRNIRRKQVPDTIWAWKQFCDQLPLEKAKKCALILHTQKVDNNGTDLPQVIEALCGNEPERYNFIFSDQRLTTQHMNYLYNCSNVQIQLTSNEGWGLSLTEALLVGNPIIANVTGGMQDQMRFIDENGNWFTPNSEIPSNHRKTYTEHGEWAFPVFPASISIVGSPPTPYIWDDRCEAKDAADQLFKAYSLGTTKLKEKGLKGRKWAMSKEARMTSEQMAYTIMEHIDHLLETWTPREKYSLIKIEDHKPNYVPHKLNY